MLRICPSFFVKDISSCLLFSSFRNYTFKYSQNRVCNFLFIQFIFQSPPPRNTDATWMITWMWKRSDFLLSSIIHVTTLKDIYIAHHLGNPQWWLLRFTFCTASYNVLSEEPSVLSKLPIVVQYPEAKFWSCRANCCSFFNVAPG